MSISSASSLSVSFSAPAPRSGTWPRTCGAAPRSPWVGGHGQRSESVSTLEDTVFPNHARAFSACRAALRAHDARYVQRNAELARGAALAFVLGVFGDAPSSSSPSLPSAASAPPVRAPASAPPTPLLCAFPAPFPAPPPGPPGAPGGTESRGASAAAGFRQLCAHPSARLRGFLGARPELAFAFEAREGAPASPFSPRAHLSRGTILHDLLLLEQSQWAQAHGEEVQRLSIGSGERQRQGLERRRAATWCVLVAYLAAVTARRGEEGAAAAMREAGALAEGQADARREAREAVKRDRPGRAVVRVPTERQRDMLGALRLPH